jgi:hypothetical protein
MLIVLNLILAIQVVCGYYVYMGSPRGRGGAAIAVILTLVRLSLMQMQMEFSDVDLHDSNMRRLSHVIQVVSSR